jgi:hypothetical protein
MSRSLRRYEILLPLRFNDGQPVPDDLVADTLTDDPAATRRLPINRHFRWLLSLQPEPRRVCPHPRRGDCLEPHCPSGLGSPGERSTPLALRTRSADLRSCQEPWWVAGGDWGARSEEWGVRGEENGVGCRERKVDGKRARSGLIHRFVQHSGGLYIATIVLGVRRTTGTSIPRQMGRPDEPS